MTPKQKAALILIFKKAQPMLPEMKKILQQGFSIPINEWLRSEGESGLMARMEGLPAVINLDEVHCLVRGHIAGRANGGRLFALLMLAIAMRNIHS